MQLQDTAPLLHIHVNNNRLRLRLHFLSPTFYHPRQYAGFLFF